MLRSVMGIVEELDVIMRMREKCANMIEWECGLGDR